MRRRTRSAALSLHRHSVAQLALDGALAAVAYVLAYRLRFDTAAGVPERYDRLLHATLPWAVGLALVTFMLFRLEQKQWRYAGQRDHVALVQAVLVTTLALAGLIAVAKPVTVPSTSGDVAVTPPTSVLVMFGLLLLALNGGVRFVVRTVYERPLHGFRARRDARRVLVVGAGDGGRLVLREILRNPELGLNPVGFVDDDPLKQGMRVDGVRVLGPTEDLSRILDEAEPDELIIAIPSAPGSLRARVVRAARDRGMPVRTLPTVFELLRGAGGTMVRQVREVRVAVSYTHLTLPTILLV